MSHHEAVASIIATARTSLPELVERVAHRIRTEIPCYAAGDVVAPADLRASVRANVDYILDSLAGTARANLSAPDATGRTRAAQGVPLAEMLTAYRVGVAELWSALVTAAHGGGELHQAGWALAGLLATRVVAAGPPHPRDPRPRHRFRHHAGGIFCITLAAAKVT